MDIFDALASVASYNGWHDVLCEIRDYLTREVKRNQGQKYWSIAFPEFLGTYDVDLYPRTIWFIMVEMFGECGCSPRFGWIESDKARDAIEFISQLCLQSADPDYE